MKRKIKHRHNGSFTVLFSFLKPILLRAWSKSDEWSDLGFVYPCLFVLIVESETTPKPGRSMLRNFN